MAESYFTQQESSKTAPNTRAETAAGNRINPGPYIGIVKNVIDPTFSGAINVYIPELGGDPDDVGSWKKMMYATPFYGRTNIQDGKDYGGSPHSYGMWFVAPDVENKVLCIFANGDPAKGYWFACIPDWPALHMVPGISAPVNEKDGKYPVVDHYDNKDNPTALSDLRILKKQIHDHQYKIWEKQKLHNDPDRGPMRSSAQRETPSAVFGISTPGRPINRDEPKIQTDPTTGKNTIGVRGRLGGHTLVMDDGDYNGENQVFRLRSAAGHMILMNDTKEFIYIINSSGTSWIEMNKEGAINIFSGSQMNITAKTGFNLETTGPLKLHGKTVDIVADDGFSLKAKDINILAEGAAKLTAKSELHLLSKKNAYLTGDACIQIKSNGHIDADSSCHTINTNGATPAKEASEAAKPKDMPASEPWSGHQKANDPTAGKSYGSRENIPTGNQTYGTPNNFGSGGAQQYYGPITNNTPPVTYGPEADYRGAGYGQNQNASGIDWQTVGTIGGAVAGVVLSSGGGYNTNDTSPATQSDYSIGELQNNPGNLPYNNTDRFAVGYNNNLSVYAKPEDGIAALAVVFDNLNTSITTRSIDLIQGFINAKSNSDPKVIDFTRYMQNNTGFVADDHIALSDPATRISWIAYVIKYLQGRIIYTYDQIVTGCAYSVNLDYTSFLSGIQPVTKPWQNNNGANPFSGFVNPANDSGVVNNGNSPLKTIASGLLGGFLGNQLGRLLDGSNQQTNQDTPQPLIVNVNDINGARRYLESNPDTASGTVFQYPDGSNFRLGGGGSNRLSDYPGIFENGTVFGNQQCAAIPQSTINNFGTMASLQRGDAVLNNFNIPPGTVITTFNFKDANGNAAYGPTNAPGGVSGYSHTAILLGQGNDDKGQYIIVQDQWAGSGGCGVRKIYKGGPEGADQFYVAKSAANGYDSGGVRVPGSENYNPVDPKIYESSGSPLPPPRPQNLEANETLDRGRDFTAPRYANPGDIAGGGFGNAGGYRASSAEISAAAPTSETNAYSFNQRADNFDAASVAAGLAQSTNNIPVSTLADRLPGDVSGTAAANIQNEIYKDSLSISLDTREPVPPDYAFAPTNTQNFDAASAASGLSNNVTFTSVNDRDAQFDRDYNLSKPNLGVTLPDNPQTDLILTSPTTIAVRPEIANDQIINAPPTPVNPIVGTTSYYDPRTNEVVTTTVSPITARPDVNVKTGQVTSPPITGGVKPTGTGGTSGAQKTPQGAAQTGAGGKSC